MVAVGGGGRRMEEAGGGGRRREDGVHQTMATRIVVLYLGGDDANAGDMFGDDNSISDETLTFDPTTRSVPGGEEDHAAVFTVTAGA
jgi:hypothetical protein